MVLITLIIVFAGASYAWWFRLGRLQEQNILLRAEIVKLRGRLRTLQP